MREVLETMSAEFCSTLMISVTDELTWQVVTEALEDAMFEESVLEAVCREEVARLSDAVVTEVVCEVVRSVEGSLRVKTIHSLPYCFIPIFVASGLALLRFKLKSWWQSTC